MNVKYRVVFYIRQKGIQFSKVETDFRHILHHTFPNLIRLSFSNGHYYARLLFTTQAFCFSFFFLTLSLSFLYPQCAASLALCYFKYGAFVVYMLWHAVCCRYRSKTATTSTYYAQIQDKERERAK